MLPNEKKTFLIGLGWKEVFGEWQAPVTFTGKPHYFALETAYALETTGEGIIAYATESLTGELLQAADVAFIDAQEASRRAAGGEIRGTYPNY